MSYRVDNADARTLGESMRDIKNAIYELCQMSHDCKERECTFCIELEDMCVEIEGKIRRACGNPICQDEARELEQFLACV